jgi:hypothetical protein
VGVDYFLFFYDITYLQRPQTFIDTITSLFQRLDEIEKRLDTLESSRSSVAVPTASDRASKPVDALCENVPDLKANTEKASQDTTSDTTEPIQRFVQYRQKKWDQTNGWHYMDVKSTELITQQPLDQKQKPLRYDITRKGGFKLTIFNVLGPAKLYEEFMAICPPKGYDDVTLFDNRIKITSAIPLWHCMEKLRALEKNDDKPDDLHKQVKALIDLCEQGPISQAHKRVKQLVVNDSRVDFETLGALFQPGDLVLWKELRDQWATGRVTRVSQISTNRETGLDELTISCERIGFDGKNFCYVIDHRPISVFAGTRKITDLPLYPLKKYVGDREVEKLTNDLIKRGQDWEKLLHGRDVQVRQYSGYGKYHDENKGSYAQVSQQ